jgi:hypothetical protein
MANNRKPAANTSKKPAGGERLKATKENIRPRPSTATRSTLALKPTQTHASNDSEIGVKDAETAALVASLRG